MPGGRAVGRSAVARDGSNDGIVDWTDRGIISIDLSIDRQELTSLKVGSVAPEQWALGALLFGAGQVLNMSVYKALGG